MGIRNWFRRTAVPENRNTVDMVEQFVDALETGITEEWCLCKWRIHPDDQGGKIGHCVFCGMNRNGHVAKNHNYRGVRKVRVDDHPHCPLHTKEGLILKYLEWTEKQNAAR